MLFRTFDTLAKEQRSLGLCLVTFIAQNIPIAGSGMSGTLFERCAVEGDGDQAMMLQCVANAIESSSAAASSDLDQWLLVLAGALVFFMQVRS